MKQYEIITTACCKVSANVLWPSKKAKLVSFVCPKCNQKWELERLK
jgi:hypothetical protein